MIRVQPILGDFMGKMREKYPQAVREGTSEGIRSAAATLADEVSARTPVKSGVAQAFVYDKMIGPLKGRVGYDPKSAWYMRFVEFGTKRHPIYAKGRKGSRATQRISAHARRHAAGMNGWVWDDSPLSQNESSEWSQYAGRTKRTRTKGKLKRALTVNGRLFTKVMHPGIRPRLTLFNSLEASREKITNTIKTSIFVKIDQARGN